MRHQLKCMQPYFNAVESGAKTFEVRKDDRGFNVGDVLELTETAPGLSPDVAGMCVVTVTYILDGGAFGIEPGYVVMGIKRA